jgi:hypothetical protein
LIERDLTSGEFVIIDVEFQVGDLVALINFAKEDIIAIGMVCGQHMSPMWHPY